MLSRGFWSRESLRNRSGLGLGLGQLSAQCFWRITTSASSTHIGLQHIWNIINSFWLRPFFIIVLCTYIPPSISINFLSIGSYAFPPKWEVRSCRSLKHILSSYIYLWTILCPDLASGSANMDFCACLSNWWSFAGDQRAMPVNEDRK